MVPSASANAMPAVSSGSWTGPHDDDLLLAALVNKIRPPGAAVAARLNRAIITQLVALLRAPDPINNNNNQRKKERKKEE